MVDESNRLAPGDVVRLKSGGPTMTTETDLGNNRFTFTWMVNGVAHSLPLPAALVIRVESESPYHSDRTLLPTQRNQVFREIASSGLDPKQFSWETVESSAHQRPDVTVDKLTHASGFYFIFNSTRDGEYFFSRSPGTSKRVDSGEAGNWATQLVFVSQWLLIL